MALLTADLGWSMGWCLVRRGDRVTSGMLDLRHHNRTDGLRLLAMTQWLTSTLGQLEAANEKLDEIVYERITFVGKNDADTVHAHGKQLGNLERWAALKKQPVPRGIAWDVIKKHITGHRSAAKETILAEIQKRYPDVADHNEASAVAVMLTATHGRRAAHG